MFFFFVQNLFILTVKVYYKNNQSERYVLIIYVKQYLKAIYLFTSNNKLKPKKSVVISNRLAKKSI